MTEKKRGASVFPPIPVDHPLAEAARNSNSMAEERGLEETIKWAGMNLDAGQLAYLAEQRAYRAIAASLGFNLGAQGDQELDNVLVAMIHSTALWQEFGPILMSAYMDGITIGWVGRRIAEGDAA